MASEFFKFQDLPWGKSLKRLQLFNPDVFKNYIGDCGSQRLLKEGYSLYISAYLKDMWTSERMDGVVVTAKCYPRMRKNDTPWKMFCHIQDGHEMQIVSTYCTCKAGLGKCKHVVGLFHQLNHFIMMGYEDIPEEMTCTSLEQQWHKPRGNRIEADFLMNSVFAKPKVNRKGDPLSCSFNGIDDFTPTTSEEIQALIAGVEYNNPDAPLAYLLTASEINDAGPPTGSTLGHQLKSYLRSDVKIMCTANRPLLPLSLLQTEINVPEIPYKLTIEEAFVLERDTREQNNELWQKARQPRLTASQFAVVCKRKKITNLFLQSLYEPQNLDNIKNIRYGKRNEEAAKSAFMEAAISAGRKLALFKCGFIVNPGAAFLGCSPDGILIDEAEPDPGLLEVKCPISKKGKTLEEACEDPKFYLCCVNNKILLKESSNYYHQVQGQMLLTGTKWCNFAVFNGKDIWVSKVSYNDYFCEQMLQQLGKFFCEHFQPFVYEKLNPRKVPMIVHL